MHAAYRDAQTRAITRKHNPTQRSAVTHQPQRDAVQRRTRDDTYPQSQYCGTAPYSLRSRQRRQCTPKTRILHRAYDAATMLHISQAQRTPHAHADQRRAPRHHHTTHTRTDTHDATSPTQNNTTSASWRVSPNTAHANMPRTTHRTLTRSIQTHKHHTPARRPAHQQPLRTAQTSPHAHRRAHATHGTAHSYDHPIRRPQKITPSHTRGLRAILTQELSGCPASMGCCR